MKIWATLAFSTLGLVVAAWHNTPTVSGHTLDTGAASSARGGFQSMGTLTMDAECYLSQECTVPTPLVACADNGSNNASCLQGSEFVDSVKGDMPVGCGIDAPGVECRLSQTYVCAVVYQCYVNVISGTCEVDYSDILKRVNGATTCEDTSGP